MQPEIGRDAKVASAITPAIVKEVAAWVGRPCLRRRDSWRERESTPTKLHGASREMIARRDTLILPLEIPPPPPPPASLSLDLSREEEEEDDAPFERRLLSRLTGMHEEAGELRLIFV